MIQAYARALLILGLLGLWPAAPAQAQDRATVFAAASLSGVLEQMIPAPEAVFSYAGSGAIARQVVAGAPVDLVILANMQWMDWLLEQGAEPAAAPQNIATNQLVVVAPSGTKPLTDAANLVAALGTGRLAMGQHKAVPAGQYAQAWLQSAGEWDAIAPRTLETQNVRAALALVTRGEAPFGVVYASDAQRTRGVSVVYKVPADSHAPILYPAAAFTPRGVQLLARLRAQEAQSILRQNGFGPAP